MSTTIVERQIEHADGRVELTDTSRVDASPLSNHDIAPVPLSQRNWSTYNYAALWISMAHCIPTYMLSSGLISAGMNWWQALFTILLGNTIVLPSRIVNSACFQLMPAANRPDANMYVGMQCAMLIHSAA